MRRNDVLSVLYTGGEAWSEEKKKTLQWKGKRKMGKKADKKRQYRIFLSPNFVLSIFLFT